jgi:hypothetical protein
MVYTTGWNRCAKTKGPVMMKHSLIYSLVSLCSMLPFISGARAQCTPVVYAFRHAEDFGRNLTLVGRQHAALYPAMVANFGASHDYCPVGYVYSMYEINPNGKPGTNNPFQTAQPLAAFVCGDAAFSAGLDPYTTCVGSASEPRTSLASVNGGGNLYEYLGIEGAPRTTELSASGSQLRDELLQHAGDGSSSAIFWSSQGLSVLGQAIVPGFTGIPGCSRLPTQKNCEKLIAPRNAAYIFAFNGSAFKPPDNVTQYVQCFNVHITDFSTPPVLDGPAPPEPIGPGPTTYYCGNGIDRTGNLPWTSGEGLAQTFQYLDLLLGKICDTSKGRLIETGPRGYYGYCQ